jgi:hypothetical protein
MQMEGNPEWKGLQHGWDEDYRRILATGAGGVGKRALES